MTPEHGSSILIKSMNFLSFINLPLYCTLLLKFASYHIRASLTQHYFHFHNPDQLLQASENSFHKMTKHEFELSGMTPEHGCSVLIKSYHHCNALNLLSLINLPLYILCYYLTLLPTIYGFLLLNTTFTFTILVSNCKPETIIFIR